MAAHLGHFGVGQAARFEQDRVGDADLADVVQVAADPDRHLLMLIEPQHRGHPLREDAQLPAVLAGLEVAGFDRRRKRQRDRVQDRAQIAVLERLVAHLGRSERAAHLGQELLAGERLDEHSRRAFTECLDGRVDGPVARHDHHGQIRLPFPKRPHQGEAVHSGHVDVGDNDVEIAVPETRHRDLGLVAHDRLEALNLEQPPKYLQDRRFVVDAEDPRPSLARVWKSQFPGHAASSSNSRRAPGPSAKPSSS